MIEPFAFERPLCGARTRSGKPCKAPARCGAKRCRMHGGVVRGSGAPKNNQNALKHGQSTRKAKQRERALNALLRSAHATLKETLGPRQR